MLRIWSRPITEAILRSRSIEQTLHADQQWNIFCSLLGIRAFRPDVFKVHFARDTDLAKHGVFQRGNNALAATLAALKLEKSTNTVLPLSALPSSMVSYALRHSVEETDNPNYPSITKRIHVIMSQKGIDTQRKDGFQSLRKGTDTQRKDGF